MRNRSIVSRAIALGCMVLGLVAVVRVGQNASTSAMKPPNVLFVVLDTVRADHLPIYGYPRDTAPVLAHLAEHALVFEKAFATGPWTVPSHASMFTGKMPGELDIGWSWIRLRPDVPTMAESFAEAGYVTGGIFQNPMLEDPSFGRGFSHWQKIYLGKTEAAVRQLLQKTPTSRPLFLFVNLIAPHLVYNPSAKYRWRFVNDTPERVRDLSHSGWHVLLESHRRGELSDRDLETLRGLYDAEILWADQELGEIFAAFNETRRSDNAIVVVTSDHGENIGDHDLFDHQLCAYNSLLHVPLVLWAPGYVAPRRVSTPVSLLHLWKTLADISQLPDRETVPGRSLLQPSEDPPLIVSEYDRPAIVLRKLAPQCPSCDVKRYDRSLVAVQDDRFKLIFASDEAHELFDLRRDPREERNLYPGDLDAEAAGAFTRLRAIALTTTGDGRKPDTELSEADLERLRSLGYLPGGQ